MMNWDAVMNRYRRETAESVIPLYTTEPALPEMRLRWLAASGADDALESAVAASLVSSGLLMHDRIDPSPSSGRFSPEQLRRMQVDILGGDYYSSRFYRLLSRIGRLDLVQALCEGIVSVNRMKLTLFEHLRAGHSAGWQVYREGQTGFRDALFEPLAAFVPEAFREEWVEGNRMISLFEWISAEWEAFDRGAFLASEWAGIPVFTDVSELKARLMPETEMLLASVRNGEQNSWRKLFNGPFSDALRSLDERFN